MKTFDDFFGWCHAQGMQRDRTIANALFYTPQTIANWRKSRSRAARGELPRHIILACRGYEASRKNNRDPAPMSKALFENWRAYNGLKTLESTGKAFGLTRQAIHNWERREKLPKWLGLACLGYQELKIMAKSQVSEG